MDNKKIIIVLAVVVIILAIMTGFLALNSYKEVNEDFVQFPTPNEKVKFSGTYLGPYGGIWNVDQSSGVIQVGNAYAIVNTDKLQGMEGETVTVKGYFVNDKVESSTVQINGKFINGESFCIQEVL
ncbi:hypothetical protein [uncultured Methanobrevibacter sp.]|uniref:hypothetical protein n=1 Tax=uncultured Methanobrevibacter sp. TaxID=253161 RepID=UPI0025EA71A9|nr:hypothetical protein [uncultured Methanobrevibacter sp.]